MTEFLRPRFVGARFEDGTIPLEMLSELSALGELVIEAAKWRYLKAHPDRKRSPKGFTDEAHFMLVGLDKGSAVPVIDLQPRVKQKNFPMPGIKGEYESYYEEARDLIIGAIAAAENGNSTTDFLPQHCLSIFDRIGRRLRDGESLEFPTSMLDRPAVLTKESRRRLLRAAQMDEITQEIDILCEIHEVDQDRMTFKCQLGDGRKVDGTILQQHFSVVLEVFNSYNTNGKASIQGIGKYDRQERLNGIESIESITPIDPLDVVSRLAAFREMKDGWLENDGRAPSPTGLTWLSETFEQFYPDDIQQPHVYPTLEGGVRMEWSHQNNAIILEIDLTSHSGDWLWFDRNSDSEHERQLDLNDRDSWTWLASELRTKTANAG